MHSERYVAIEVERHDDGSGWITLNRPDAINAINDAMRAEVPAALASLEADPDIRVIALRGAGPRGFCAGADLKEAARSSSTAENPRSAWIQAFDTVTKPIVAAVHGYCLGGGFEIALACDLRIAASDSVFGLPETGLGLIPGGGGTQRLPRLIGLGSALDLLITGRRVEAETAQRMGLLAQLCPAGASFPDESANFVAALAKRPPMALRFAKQAAREGMERSLADGLQLEAGLFAKLQVSEDRREAARAFAEKRSPVFKNR